MEWQPDDPDQGRLLNASVDGEPLVIPWIEECDSEGKVRDSCKSAVSESLTLFERTFPIDVITGHVQNRCVQAVRTRIVRNIPMTGRGRFISRLVWTKRHCWAELFSKQNITDRIIGQPETRTGHGHPGDGRNRNRLCT
uniref:hypothetical protein n=1 Tax=Klebsiella pneumoniae TaxID=573 RepID=UPI00155DBE0C